MSMSERNEMIVELGRDHIQSTLRTLKSEIANMEKYMSDAPTDPELRLATTVHNLYAIVASLHTTIATNAGIIRGYTNQQNGMG